MKKKWIFILAGVLALGITLYAAVRLFGSSLVKAVFIIPLSEQTADQQKTLDSLEVINDHPFYQMTYTGDYKQFLALKEKYYWGMGLPRPHCSTFTAGTPDGHVVMAYNSDGEHRPLLLVYTDPTDGYASVSIVDIGENFGFDESHTPFDSQRLKSLLLYSPYYTNTGMNEMGLAFGVMADPSGSSKIDQEKDTTFASEIRRYILDYAKDVDQAIAILSTYNVSYNVTIASIILIADRSSKSALVEWVDGEMKVIYNQQPWQVSTNFRVYGAQELINQYTEELRSTGKIAEDTWGKNYWRYITAWETLARTGGILTADQSMELLNTISLVVALPEVIYDTQYSVVFDLTSGEFQIVTDRDYENSYQFSLTMNLD